MNQEVDIKKYEELYRLSKDGLEEELERFTRLDEKASRYFSVLGILVVASGIAGKFSMDSIIPPKYLWDWLSLVSSIAFVIAVVISLLNIFSVLRTKPLTKIPMTDELVRFFDENTYLDAIYALTKGNVTASKENQLINLKKTQRLTWGYRFIVTSILIFLFFIFVLAIRTWILKTL